MRIGILTHPQGANYGGLLQCYALYTYLKKLGHEPVVIQRVANRSFFLWAWTRAILKALHFPRYYKPAEPDRLANIRPFIHKELVRTTPIDSHRKIKQVCKNYRLEAVIVGSDQVWRADYAMKFGYNYFLDFVPDNVIKTSYAASFGLSNWQYNSTQTEKIKQLLSRFNGISVREEEAIPLLRSNIGHEAIQLLDPTLLLTSADYNSITSPRLEPQKYVFVYWLGIKAQAAAEISKYKKAGYRIIELYLRDVNEQISVEDWLSYIKYADIIITDSFHGSVFSILFKRQFSVLGNESGGNGRISSLCSMFGISPDNNKDYADIDAKLYIYRQQASEFIRESLNR